MKARAGDRGSIVWIPSALYQGIWDADLGEQLPCQREPMNSKDPFAVAVVKSHVTVGHIPRKISSICSMFLRHGGTINCRVTASRRYSRDLPQGGLEVYTVRADVSRRCEGHSEGQQACELRAFLVSRYFYRQWTLRIRQFVVGVLLEVAVEGHLERKEAGSELAIIRVP